MWTNIVPNKLESYLGDSALVTLAYSNPFGFAAKYPPGTIERAAIARAQDEAQVRHFPLISLDGIADD
jgi:SIT family siderophore-iron:H+ symporter-like MFS transporter